MAQSPHTDITFLDLGHTRFVDTSGSSAYLICILRSDHNVGRIVITRPVIRYKRLCSDVIIQITYSDCVLIQCKWGHRNICFTNQLQKSYINPIKSRRQVIPLKVLNRCLQMRELSRQKKIKPMLH